MPSASLVALSSTTSITLVRTPSMPANVSASILDNLSSIDA